MARQSGLTSAGPAADAVEHARNYGAAVHGGGHGQPADHRGQANGKDPAARAGDRDPAARTGEREAAARAGDRDRARARERDPSAGDREPSAGDREPAVSGRVIDPVAGARNQTRGKVPAAGSRDQAPASPPHATVPTPVSGPQPSWAHVIGTTLRLWLQRQVLRPLRHWGGLSTTRRQVARVAIAVAVIIAAGLLGIGMSGGFRTTSAGPGTAARASGTAPKGAPGGSPNALAAAAADRQAAASWIAAQVDRAAIVACDPVMCSALAADGFPAANLIYVTSATTDPLGSEIVVSTEAVRTQFGSKLADVYAPAILASFGSGTASVAVRVMAPDGASAYLNGLSADMSARRSAGAQLLRNPGLQVSGTARSDLASGQVDSRLLATLVNLTAQYRVRVLAFGDAGPGASPGIPLRYAEIAVQVPGGRPGGGPALSAVLNFLRAQIPPYRAAGIQVASAAGEPVVRIEFAAPSPPGLLGGAG